MRWCVLTLCTVGVLSEALRTATAGRIGVDRHRRSPAEIFLSILTDTDQRLTQVSSPHDRPISKNIEPVLPNELTNIAWVLALGPQVQLLQPTFKTVKVPSLDVVATNINQSPLSLSGKNGRMGSGVKTLQLGQIKTTDNPSLDVVATNINQLPLNHLGTNGSLRSGVETLQPGQIKSIDIPSLDAVASNIIQPPLSHLGTNGSLGSGVETRQPGQIKSIDIPSLDAVASIISQPPLSHLGTNGSLGSGVETRQPGQIKSIDIPSLDAVASNIIQPPLSHLGTNGSLGSGVETLQPGQIKSIDIPSLDAVASNIIQPPLSHLGTNGSLGSGVDPFQLEQRKTVDILSLNAVAKNINRTPLSHKIGTNVSLEAGYNDTGSRTSLASELVKEEPIPFSEGLHMHMFDTSSQMILSFRRQRPAAPRLPAVMPDQPLPDRIPPWMIKPVASANATAPAPPRPEFCWSMRVRVDLTATCSDYTEAFDIEWHAGSGTMRTVVEDGSTVFYRKPLADGRVNYLEIRVDRSSGNAVRRCTLSPVMREYQTDKTFPGLPATKEFVFSGYTSAEGKRLVERWQRHVVGRPGEGGAVSGESLNCTHELLITRERGETVPLSYTMVTDSSVLGPASDSYILRYTTLPAPIAPVFPNFSKECDVFDEFPHDENNTHEETLSMVVSRFDPIREFMGSTRDTKYGPMMDEFKTQYKRKYMDADEEALRKTIFIKSSRFIAAGNRLESTFKMEANFLSDRLNDEIDQLFGVQPPPDNAVEPGLLPFPYTEDEIEKISQKMDKEFDWREHGGVSPVRFQNTTCASCWAFAVAGSTEGALFKKSRKLIPLSPQCLVDCGRPYGAHGCDGTWPSYGYDYVQARGLPAWDEYTPYQAKVLECKDSGVPPVTRISGHVNVTANSEAALKVAIKNHAPNAVIVDGLAKSFIFYKSGVLKDKRCGANKQVNPGGGIRGLNHAVVAVGWGVKVIPHFILKNSWSTMWGEAGYVRIAPDSCGVLERPSYPLIEEDDIDRDDLREAPAHTNASSAVDVNAHMHLHQHNLPSAEDAYMHLHQHSLPSADDAYMRLYQRNLSSAGEAHMHLHQHNAFSAGEAHKQQYRVHQHNASANDVHTRFQHNTSSAGDAHMRVHHHTAFSYGDTFIMRLRKPAHKSRVPAVSGLKYSHSPSRQRPRGRHLRSGVYIKSKEHRLC